MQEHPEPSPVGVVAAASAAELADAAVAALLVEARLTPKPGLVDAENPGAHHDMDLALLEKSAQALRPAFLACTAWGRQAGSIAELRQIGIDGEAAMRTATGGVNTHKGALFALGLWCAALTQQPSLEQARQRVRDWACDLARLSSSPPSAGDRARAVGVAGARGLASDGYPLVFDVGLPTLAAHRVEGHDVALLRTLVALMAHNPDSNLVHRGGLSGLAQVRAWAQRLLRSSPLPEEFLTELHAANTWFVTERWSPGGSADLLALTWFLQQYLVESVGGTCDSETHGSAHVFRHRSPATDPGRYR